MKSFVEKFEENVKNNPNKPLFFDEMNTKGISYSKIDEVSSRVYSYLSSKGIGKEDFVLINLPRGVQPVMALVGVWKAGAAFTIVEDNYAPDRIEFIRKDCNCKAEINKENWNEILNMEPKAGYINADLHDAAFAIYTSGTTGNPKGVLHEYGNILRAVSSVKISENEPLVKKGEHGALVAPLNFIASTIFLMYVLYYGCELENAKLHIVSYATLKNPLALKRFMLEKTISLTFLTPSYVRMLGGQTGPFLKTMIIGSEPANNVFIKNVKLCNTYMMSESAFIVSMFKLDKSYETCPIGKPTLPGLNIKLLDEDGNEVENGEIGELCYDNPYFRGYMNLPEQTEKVLKNGIYHSGDLAKKDENGNLILLGRNNDMIKINGNRIEPAEIEAAVQAVLGVKWAGVKGFEETGSSYLCAYYTENIEVDLDKTRQELLKRLPYYMLPAYFIKIDEIPLKANGKFDRKALPAPEVKDFRNEYVEPQNEIEEKICNAFEKVLKLDRVGTNDDFYELGGDSLSAIELISILELPKLNSSEIFRGRTPEKIAKLYEEILQNDDGVSLEEKNEKAMQIAHYLTTEQLYMVDYQLYNPKSTMYNLFTMLKFDKEQFDINKLAEALNKAIKNHPALLTIFSFDDDGNIIQKYSPEIMEDITIEKISDFDFNMVKDTLVLPFKIIGSKLFRARVFETEKAAYIFFDVHHTIFDGTSFKVLMGNVGKAYMDMPMEKDYYYLMLQQRENMINTPLYEESKKYFETKYDSDNDWTTKPKPDFESNNTEMGEYKCSLEISQEQMKRIEKSFKITRNEFFITVTSLAIAIYNNKPNVKMSWIYNGRDSLVTMSSVGLLFKDLPIAFKFKPDVTIREIYLDAHKQVQKAIEHSVYPYVDRNVPEVSDDVAYLLYQRDIRDVGKMDGMEPETIDIRQNQAASQTNIDIQILDASEGLQIMIDYSASIYKDESIEKFKDIFIKVAHILLKYDSQKDVTIGQIIDEAKDKNNTSIFNRIKGIFSRKK